MILYKYDYQIGREERAALLSQKPAVIWLTGLSGSGKSTIANALATRLYANGNLSYVLDGDNIRSGLNKDLGFGDDARRENIRRISEVAKLMSDAGLIVITAFISPFIEERTRAREIIGPTFCEIYVDADLEECELRDPKGLYKRARAGEIPNFTGIDSPYEPPISPELVLKTGESSLEECVDQIINYISKINWINLK
jgi:adenylylsulfate kinase